ncbi:MAG: SDR family NAD(P)-dependent oxidoreductase [Alphaproteobacteria bacterium]
MAEKRRKQEGPRRTALITGASAGIGAAFAREYARHGWDLVLTARREQRLLELADELKDRHGTEAAVLTADLADPSAPDKLAEALHGRGLQVDALVNNAGYGIPKTFLKTSWREQADFIQVMATSVAHLTHLLGPGMVERGFGRIVNVASLAGFAPGTYGHTLYGASKAFLIKFSQSLHLELRGTGVHVTAVCPGFTYSEFHDVTGVRAQVSRMPSYMWMTAERVARQGYRASERNKAVLVNGLFNKTVATLIRFVPDSMALEMSNRRVKAYSRKEVEG